MHSKHRPRHSLLRLAFTLHRHPAIQRINTHAPTVGRIRMVQSRPVRPASSLTEGSPRISGGRTASTRVTMSPRSVSPPPRVPTLSIATAGVGGGAIRPARLYSSPTGVATTIPRRRSSSTTSFPTRSNSSSPWPSTTSLILPCLSIGLKAPVGAGRRPRSPPRGRRRRRRCSTNRSLFHLPIRQPVTPCRTR